MRRTGDRYGPMQVPEEAVLLARRAPWAAWAAYLVGTVPFVMGLLYFWSDMSRGALAYERCAPAALGLALLFVGMKCGQAVYAAKLHDVMSRRIRPLSARRIRRICWLQAATQPLGLLAIPLALIAMIPFAHVHGFFQNLTVLGDGETTDTKLLRTKAWKYARLDPLSHHLTIWLLSPWILGLAMILSFGLVWFLMAVVAIETGYDPLAWFIVGALLYVLVMWPLSPLGFALVLNLGLLFVYLPELLRILFGWDTIFRLSSGYAVANTTFLAALFGVAFLCLDPILKAAYVIRCFKQDSLTTGRDILVALETQRAAQEDAE